MLKFIRSTIKKILPRSIKDIPINECVHYCGFRYGGNGYNPYQTYIVELSKGIPKLECREKFTDFLKHYRPKNMGEALGITLTNYVPLWSYPWNKIGSKDFLDKRNKWLADPNDCPDILTHFSDKGILEFRVLEEFVWLEKAYYLIKKNGYIPKEYKNYAEVIRFISADGHSRYLVIDGNHRISALHALGVKNIRAIVRSTIYEKGSDKWYGVRKNLISKKDASKIFNAYFEENNNYRIGEETKIIP